MSNRVDITNKTKKLLLVICDGAETIPFSFPK